MALTESDGKKNKRYGNDKAAKKSKVDPSIFKMAEQRDY